MNFWARLAAALDGLSGGAVRAEFREARTAYDDDPRATEYRRLTSTKRDWMPLQYDRALQLSYSLWQRNPLARRMVQLMMDFTIGPELQVKVEIEKEGPNGRERDTERKDAQEVWEAFASHPANDFPKWLPKYAQDTFINGELILPTNVGRMEIDGGEVVGIPVLGYIDPMNVAEVVVDAMDVKAPKEIRFRPETAGGKEVSLRVVARDADPKSPTYGLLTGEVLYWRINHVTNQTRGNGVLVEMLDWIDLLDQFMFDALEGYRVRNSFFYGVKMEGLTADEIEQEAKRITTPANGTVRVHNEKAQYYVVAPDLKATDVDTAFKTFLTLVVGAKGFPVMWFGTGEDANRATAEAMSLPTLEMLRGMQEIVKTIVRDTARYVCDQAVMSGRLKLAEDESICVDVSMYDLTSKEATSISAGMVQLVQALKVAVESNWITNETAKRVVDGVVVKLGVEVPENETTEKVKEENDQARDENALEMGDPEKADAMRRAALAAEAAKKANGKGVVVPDDEEEDEEEDA